VLWDGKHVAVADAGTSPSAIYQFAMSGSSGTKTGETILTNSALHQFWIQGGKVLGADNSDDVGLWKYPSGGAELKGIPTQNGYGAAVVSVPMK